MRREMEFVAVLIVSTLLAPSALAQSAETSLYGRWSVDAESAILEKTEERTEDGRIKASAVVAPQALEFTRKKTFIITSGEGDSAETASGTWKVLDEKPGHLKLELSVEGDRPTITVQIQPLYRDKLRLRFPDGNAAIYHRVPLKPQPAKE